MSSYTYRNFWESLAGLTYDEMREVAEVIRDNASGNLSTDESFAIHEWMQTLSDAAKVIVPIIEKEKAAEREARNQ